MRPRLSLVPILFFLLSQAQVSAQDCNNNGTPDSVDIAPTAIRVTRLGPITTPFSLTAVDLSDFNNDGRFDVLLAARESETSFVATLALQDGDRFSSLPDVALGSEATGIAAADLNNDRFTDILFSGAGGQTALVNQGDNTFTPVAAQAGTPIADDPRLPNAGRSQVDIDLNGDARADRLQIADGRIEVLLRSESGSLELSQTFPVEALIDCSLLPAPVGLSIAAVEDLDGDGDIDAAVIASSSCDQLHGTVRQSELRLLENDEMGSFDVTVIPLDGSYSYAGARLDAGPQATDLVFSFVSSSANSFPISVPRITQSGVAVIRVRPETASRDRNDNDIPDECERAVPGDFGGDGLTDLTVVRDFNGLFKWLTRFSTERSQFEPQNVDFGLSGFDLPYAGDFDGDGRFEPGVVRDAGAIIPELFGLYWYALKSDSTVEVVQFGLSGDIPLTGHFDTDTRTDRAVVRDVLGQLVWFTRTAEGEVSAIPWGLTGDEPLTGDVTEDGIDDLVVVRTIGGALHWFIRTLDGSFTTVVPWGLAGDRPLKPTDLDGVTLGSLAPAELVVVRPNGRFLNFYLRNALGGSSVVDFGLFGDVPSIGMFTREQPADISVFRPAPPSPFFSMAQHYQLTAGGSILVRTWGLFGDILIAPDGRAMPQ